MYNQQQSTINQNSQSIDNSIGIQQGRQKQCYFNDKLQSEISQSNSCSKIKSQTCATISADQQDENISSFSINNTYLTNSFSDSDKYQPKDLQTKQIILTNPKDNEQNQNNHDTNNSQKPYQNDIDDIDDEYNDNNLSVINEFNQFECEKVVYQSPDENDFDDNLNYKFKYYLHYDFIINEFPNHDWLDIAHKNRFKNNRPTEDEQNYERMEIEKTDPHSNKKTSLHKKQCCHEKIKLDLSQESKYKANYSFLSKAYPDFIVKLNQKQKILTDSSCKAKLFGYLSKDALSQIEKQKENTQFVERFYKNMRQTQQIETISQAKSPFLDVQSKYLEKQIFNEQSNFFQFTQQQDENAQVNNLIVDNQSSEYRGICARLNSVLKLKHNKDKRYQKSLKRVISKAIFNLNSTANKKIRKIANLFRKDDNTRFVSYLTNKLRDCKNPLKCNVFESPNVKHSLEKLHKKICLQLIKMLKKEQQQSEIRGKLFVQNNDITQGEEYYCCIKRKQ